MRKHTSKLIGREFYVDPVCSDPQDGLPCFSDAEMKILKAMGGKITPEVLSQIFDAKTELGVTVMELIPERPAPPAETPKTGPHFPYSAKARQEVAGKWASAIAETIRNTQIRTTPKEEIRKERVEGVVKAASLP